MSDPKPEQQKIPSEKDPASTVTPTREEEANEVEKMPTIGSPDHASDPIRAPSNSSKSK